MAKNRVTKRSRRTARRAPGGRKGNGQPSLQDVLWRIERLERQVSRLSELVRQHAVDADRLVQIVAEDRELLLEELLRHASKDGKSPSAGRSANHGFNVPL